MECEDAVPAFVLPTEEAAEAAVQSDVSSGSQSTAVGVTEAMQDNILVRPLFPLLRLRVCCDDVVFLFRQHE